MPVAQIGYTEAAEPLPPQLPQAVKQLWRVPKVFLIFGDNQFTTFIVLNFKGVSPY